MKTNSRFGQNRSGFGQRKPQSSSVMAKFKYVGVESPLKLAQVGNIVTGDVFMVNTELAEGLARHGGDDFVRVADDAQVTGPRDAGGVTLEAAEKLLAAGKAEIDAKASAAADAEASAAAAKAAIVETQPHPAATEEPHPAAVQEPAPAPVVEKKPAKAK
jgi:hypothetical protein